MKKKGCCYSTQFLIFLAYDILISLADKWLCLLFLEHS